MYWPILFLPFLYDCSFIVEKKKKSLMEVYHAFSKNADTHACSVLLTNTPLYLFNQRLKLLGHVFKIHFRVHSVIFLSLHAFTSTLHIAFWMHVSFLPRKCISHTSRIYETIYSFNIHIRLAPCSLYNYAFTFERIYYVLRNTTMS